MANKTMLGPSRLVMPSKKDITNIKRLASRFKVKYSTKQLTKDIFYFYRLHERIEMKRAKKKAVKKEQSFLEKRYGKSGLLTRTKRVWKQYQQMLGDKTAIKQLDYINKNQSWPRYDLAQENILSREELLATLNAMESQINQAYDVYSKRDMIMFIDFGLLNEFFYQKIQEGYIDASCEISIINVRNELEDADVDSFTIKAKKKIREDLQAIYEAIGRNDSVDINAICSAMIGYIAYYNERV